MDAPLHFVPPHLSLPFRLSSKASGASQLRTEQPKLRIPRGGKSQDPAVTKGELLRWPAWISSSAAALIASAAQRRRGRGERKALVQRQAGYEDEYWADENFSDTPSKGSGRGRGRGWQSRNDQGERGSEYTKRMNFRKEGRRGSRWSKAAVVDQTEEVNAEAAELESMYKRPRSSKGAGKGKNQTGRLAANMPAIGTGEVWLSKFLAHAGAASRRRVTELVLQGRVKVNGEIVQAPTLKVDPEKDVVTVDGDVKRLQTLGEMVWVMVNKPRGYLCDRSDPNGRRTVVDLVPFARSRRLIPVGRIDKQASGLILLTNDLEWHTILTHKRYGYGKAYKVVVYGGRPSELKLQALRDGLQLPDQERPLLPVEDIEIVPNADASLNDEVATLTFTLYDNSYRVVRRMFEYLGHEVKSQKRVGIEALRMKNLKPGHFRQLTAKEVKQLKERLKRRSNQQQQPEPEQYSFDEDAYVEGDEDEDEEAFEEEEDNYTDTSDVPPWLSGARDYEVDEVTRRVESASRQKAQ